MDPNSITPREPELNKPRNLDPDTDAGAALFAIGGMFAIALFVGSILYVMTRDEAITASDLPPTTVGQSTRPAVPMKPGPITDVPK
jgi:hypothetical protein